MLFKRCALKLSICMISLMVLNLYASEKSAQPYEHNKTVMVFAPHPDDDIIGCGGSLIKHVREGKNVIIVYMTSGEAARPFGAGSLGDLREQEAKNAASKMGIYNLIFLRQPDGKLKKTDELVIAVTKLLEEHSVEIIYLPHKFDRQKDHKATFFIVKEAVQNIVEKNLIPLPKVLCYEVWTPIQQVTHTFDITNEIDLKLAALNEHKSQITDRNYTDGIKGLNRYRGVLRFPTCMYAECFQQI